MMDCYLEIDTEIDPFLPNLLLTQQPKPNQGRNWYQEKCVAVMNLTTFYLGDGDCGVEGELQKCLEL